jgi:hypothetical protein
MRAAQAPASVMIEVRPFGSKKILLNLYFRATFVEGYAEQS